MVFNQLVLLFGGHFVQGVVFSLQIPSECVQSLHHNLLDFPAFSACTVRGKRKTPDAASSPNAAGKHKVRIQIVSTDEVVWIQICLVARILGVTVMSRLDYRVEKIGEDFISLL